MWEPAFELMRYELVAGLENVPKILRKSHNKKTIFHYLELSMPYNE